MLDSCNNATLILYSALLSNLGYSLGLGLLTITPLWTVGVEEQFYLFWPLIVRKTNNSVIFFIIVIVAYLGLKLFFTILGCKTFSAFIQNSAFDCMAWGGVIGASVFFKSPKIRFLYNPIIQIVAWLFFIVSVIYKPIHFSSFLDQEIHAFFYSIIILNVACNPKTIISLENRVLDFIGQISYGIYVYHMIVIFFLSRIFVHTFHGSRVLTLLLIYLVTLILTILVSYLSYLHFEGYFFAKKSKYTLIESAESNAEH